MAEPTPNLWPHLYRGRVRTHARLAKAAKLLRLAQANGNLVDRPHKGDAASPLVYAAIVLVEKALKIQLETEGISWKPDK